ncbi:MAG: hypothetical protein IPK22_10995 [Verrucomicrobiaceae bacterium]|nr:hypothetical protein [Verrucomicrobiaceae bacterium]
MHRALRQRLVLHLEIEELLRAGATHGETHLITRFALQKLHGLCHADPESVSTSLMRTG